MGYMGYIEYEVQDGTYGMRYMGYIWYKVYGVQRLYMGYRVFGPEAVEIV